jgi:DnaA regulatory inactivator Hda
MMSDDRQLLLRFDHRPSLTGDDFYVAESNQTAVLWIDRWPDWPTTALVVYGPAGCGKTHLAQVFLAATAGRSLSLEDISAGEPRALLGNARTCVIDDAESVVSAGFERALLHLYNSINETGRHLLLTARRPPSRWPVDLADLRSRLNAASAIPISRPDDAMMRAILAKLFADRQVRVDEEILTFMLNRMERSFEAARSVVSEIDVAALRSRRNVGISLVRQVLRAHDTKLEDGE